MCVLPCEQRYSSTPVRIALLSQSARITRPSTSRRKGLTMNKAQLNDVKFPVLGTAALVPAEAPALVLIEGGKSRAADGEFTSQQPSPSKQCPAAVVGFIFAAVLCIALLGALRSALLRSSIEQKLVSSPTCTVRVLEEKACGPWPRHMASRASPRAMSCPGSSKPTTWKARVSMRGNRSRCRCRRLVAF